MISWSLSGENLLFLTKSIGCWSHVRNEINGLRPRAGKPDVVYSQNEDGSPGVPYMPRPFPIGDWNITGIIDHLSAKEKATGYLWPAFIATDAWQYVDEWSLDAKGFYSRPTGRKVMDYGYGIHWPELSNTTLGCGHVDTLDNLQFMVQELRELLKTAKTVPLRVGA